MLLSEGEQTWRMEVIDHKWKKQGFGFIFGDSYRRDSKWHHIDTTAGQCHWKWGHVLE
jgi:hypothetical protein